MMLFILSNKLSKLWYNISSIDLCLSQKTYGDMLFQLQLYPTLCSSNSISLLVDFICYQYNLKQRISLNQVWNFWYSCKLLFIFFTLSICQIYYILLIPCFQGQLEFRTDRIRRPDKWSCFGWTRNILNNRKKKRRNFYNFLTLNSEVFRDTILCFLWHS